MSMFTTKLDYNNVLANQRNEVHLVTRIKAPVLETEDRKPVAFTICLDRSASMGSGTKFGYALKACEGVVRNLRPDDLFSLVTFESEVEVVIPLGKVEEKEMVCQLIRELRTRRSTNLSSGWEEAKNQLLQTESGMLKRMLLLSDGMANEGITDHRDLITLVGDGMRDYGIRTSCLGFGDDYEEDLLSDMATHSTGNFYDVDTEEKLPAVFAAELEGALQISIENLRMRIKAEELCESWDDYGSMRKTRVGDGRTEFLIGDLVSQEVRSCAFALMVGSRETGYNGNLVSLEFIYDQVLEGGVVPTSESRVIPISFVDNQNDVVVDDSILGVVTTQRTSRMIRQAIEKIDQGEEDEAIYFLKRELSILENMGKPELTDDSAKLLRSTIEKTEMGWRRSRGRKFAQYGVRSYSKMSSTELWCQEEASSPSFKSITDDEL